MDNFIYSTNMNTRSKKVVLMNYCEKCDTKHWGVWQYKSINDIKESVLSILHMEKCPICGSTLKNKYKFYLAGKFYNYKGITDSLEIIKQDYYKYVNLAVENFKIYISREIINSGNYRNDDGDICSYDENIYGLDLSDGSFVTSKEYPELGQCKIIDSTDIKGKTYYICEYYDQEEFSEIYEYISDYINRTVLEKNATKKLEKLNNGYTYQISDNANFEKNKITKLSEYLKCIIDVEKNIYALNEHLKKAYLIEAVCKAKKFSAECNRKKSVVQMSEKVDALFKEYSLAINENPIEKISLDKFMTIISQPTCPNLYEPKKPTLLTPGFFNKKKIQRLNEKLLLDYNIAMSEYNKAIQDYQSALKSYQEKMEAMQAEAQCKYEEEIISAKAKHQDKCEKLKKSYEEALLEKDRVKSVKTDIVSPEEVLYSEVKNEVEKAEKLLLTAMQTRDDLYAYDVIFPKYRNIVAVATFCEYLLTGRCEKLEGSDGAYNLYENELRMNTVISQLSTVISLLEKIKDSQYLLYSAIDGANKQLQKLNSSMDEAVESLSEINKTQKETKLILSDIKENAELIAYNTAATAFYSKCNSEITAAIGFMIALS